MTFAVQLADDAVEDVEAITEHLADASGSVETAMRFFAAVRETAANLGEAPERWAKSRHAAPEDETLRQRAVRGFPNYLVFYRFDGKQVTVLRVLHGARDLGALFRR